MARFANGAVVLAMEETRVLSTVASAKGDSVRDFLPLTVIASVLSSDGKQDPDVVAANATSAALMLSDIPWGGPLGIIRIGRISGQFIVNPSMDELSLSDLNLVYACTRDKTLMIDVLAREISEKDLEAALRLAHPEAIKYLEPQIRLAAKAGKQKKEYKLSMVTEKKYDKIRSLSEAPIEAVFTDPTYGKFERGEALDRITQDVKKELEQECDEEGLKFLSKTVDTVWKQVIRRRIIGEGRRVDGRCLDEVRPLYCEAGNLTILHGSSLFSRGDTQVLCTVTLGAPGEAQHLDSLVGPPTKRFMLHYSFPPFCINEVGKRVGLNRREVGHGTLAEKALLAVLPPEEDCPYAVRINAEVMASDGSTSMASVCAGSMALLDAGIPLREHVAGLSVGLVSEVDPSTGEITDYRILTDSLGLEDHLGDMDFKIAGTQNGVTAIQLDIKPAVIPLDIICECLEPALKGRLQILDQMKREINVARSQDGRNSPRILTLKYSNDAIRRLIGPLGALKRKIEGETVSYAASARISVSDGSLTLVAKNQLVLEKVMEKVSRVTDVVSVGPALNLMCIGLDVRGNVNLSLKATLPRPGSKTNASVAAQEAPKVWDPIDNVHEKKYQDDKPLNTGASLLLGTSGVFIRSAVECEEEEKCAGLNKKSKPSSRSYKDEDESTTGKAAAEPTLTAKKLKLGTEMTAKVHQVRARGLVLDLGGGIRGMYRFEVGFRRDFEVGEEVKVKCSSFTAKGIPVVSLVEEEKS
ncbi:polyribonucleotide nucleotidyltransferase 2, mitochondrial [Olea europaea subsp. europaea]|uniref:polyribonucleotide nucleotidyltransferase n=1 Tax=Olea europaea subsp. europaea TaxID=158383 RepID=A0A8S0SW57_OLEEU|nr:polyribonucleotide nucleotidyltransferase 2, mitochondrial [Olea europaea subsp. europaea]